MKKQGAIILGIGAGLQDPGANDCFYVNDCYSVRTGEYVIFMG